MVEDVEELGSETKPQPLGDVKLPLYCKIYLCSSETAQHIAPEIALLPGGRWSKSRFIENLAASISGGVESGECVQEGTLRCF
jgi:hypothetical protein